mgnify:CR=1 FL=1|tara:strand:- start:525 stop:716 length:192 start_codon:yes stop_codon:yes gene_type:complete
MASQDGNIKVKILEDLRARLTAMLIQEDLDCHRREEIESRLSHCKKLLIVLKNENTTHVVNGA